MSEFDRIFAYCQALDEHNDRAWFHANHDQYDLARNDFYGLLDLMRFTIAQNCPALSDSIMAMQPKDWVYRVARDMRYTKGGPPYNPAFRAFLSPDRKSWRPIGYFIHLFPGNCFFGTGLWLPRPGDVDVIRHYLLEHPAKFQKALKALGNIGLGGDSLKKVPRGFEAYADSPLLPYLKLKDYMILAPLPESLFESYEKYEAEIGRLVKAMEPMRAYLAEASKGIQVRQDRMR